MFGVISRKKNTIFVHELMLTCIADMASDQNTN